MSVSSNASRRTRSAVSAVLLVGLVAISVVGSVAGLLPGSGPRAAGAAPLAPGPVDRVLVISIPHVGWADLAAVDTPNLDRLLARSAVANLTARSGGGGFASGYATLGAGKRSKGSGTSSDGMAMGVTDRFGDGTAGEAFRRRTGITRDRGLVHLGIVGLEAANADEAGGSSVGALGTAVHDAGRRTAVIGNSDGSVPDDALARYRRYLVAGLMTESGTVDAGDVSRALLEVDPDAPFGLRLDEDAVVEAFRAAWEPGAVVLVEGSDLVRAIASRAPALATQDEQSYREALERTDALVGALLEDVDFERDAVVVVSPYSSRATRGLTVVGVRAPGVEPGLMKSSSTRRDGFVLLADVAPTVLALLDIERPASMNGRPFTVDPAPATHAGRVERMIDDADAARLRDSVLTPVTIVATVIAGLVGVAALAAWEVRRRGPWRLLARVGSSWLLGFVPAVYLARLVPFHETGSAAYYAWVVTGALLFALAYESLGRRDPISPTTLGLGVIVGVLVVDLLTGARLQLSTAFGYTPSIGVRFSGVGNVAYAFLGGSTLLLAGLLAHRVGGRRGAWVASALMLVALVVDAAPMLGGDVGGSLSLTPAYLLTASMLFGVRIRRRAVIGFLAAGVAVLALAAAADLARPARDRTHLGRLITNARARGLSEITDVLGRKLSRNLDTWTTSAWRAMLVMGVLFAVYLAWRARPRVAALVSRVPELRASLVGFAVLAVLGYAVNDSGVAIPAVLAYVFVAAMVGLLVRAPVPRAPTHGPATTSSSTAPVRVATPSH